MFQAWKMQALLPEDANTVRRTRLEDSPVVGRSFDGQLEKRRRRRNSGSWSLHVRRHERKPERPEIGIKREDMLNIPASSKHTTRVIHE